MTPRIQLTNANLHYSSAAYRDTSLKSLMFKVLTGKAGGRDLRDVHALKDINLTIEKGERVGLLGHNGAGKSSLLRTIAQVYPVSSGQIDVQGRIRSLFELGLGFEPDATGRENILYRGLLLGLTPKYMREKEEEIVEFADLGEFIDYPIKTYSAGMRVRLAFAISTTVGGEILLLDEVLSAGDANFMVKAKARIESLIQDAEILVLASHSFTALKSLCERGIVLGGGQIQFDGPVDGAIKHYQAAQAAKTQQTQVKN